MLQQTGPSSFRFFSTEAHLFEMARDAIVADRGGNIEKLRTVLAQYPNIALCKDHFGYTLIMVAADTRNLVSKECCDLLLSKVTTPFINLKSKAGNTALHFAAAFGNEYMVEQLIAKGVDLDAQNEENGFALCGAAVGGHIGIVRKLLAAGAYVGLKTSLKATALDCVKNELATTTPYSSRWQDLKNIEVILERASSFTSSLRRAMGIYSL